MDPTNVPPPSPVTPSPPPPPNPHTPINAIIDATAFDRYQKCEPSTSSSRNMDNFRSLVLKCARRLLPAHQSLIERRFDDVFSDDLLVPDHPPYADMILSALWELNKEGSSSEEAISDFIKKEYHELPWAHATMLNHHLRDLCMKGKIAMTRDGCYICCSSITKPIPNPGSSHHLSRNSSCSSPISSPSASLSSSPSSASLSFSPSSSSSSLCYGSPYQRRKWKKRKNLKGRGGNTVPVSGRGRGRGRGKGTQPKRVRAGKHVKNKVRQRGRPRKEAGIGEKSQIEKEQMEVIGGYEERNELEESKQVNEVTGMEVEEDALQDGGLYNVVVSDNQQGQEDGDEKLRNHPQEKNNAVVETGQKVSPEWSGNVKEKEESVGLRQSGRRKYDVSKEEDIPSEEHMVGMNKKYQPQKYIGHGEHTHLKGFLRRRGSGSKQHSNKEQHQPCEQLEEGFEEQDHQRKRPDVFWLGRRVRKLKETDDEVTEIEDGVSEEEYADIDARYVGMEPELEDGACEEEDGELLRKNTVKGETNVEHNRPDENQQPDIIEKQTLEEEQLVSVTDDKKLPCERYLGMEPELEVAEKLHLMTRNDTEDVGVIKELNGKQKQVEGESMEQNGSHLLQNDLSGEQADLQKQSKDETEDELHTQGQQLEGSMQQEELQKREVKMADDQQDSVMMQCEAQMTVAIQEKQHNDTVKKQPKEDDKEKFQTHVPQNGGNSKQETLEKQVHMVGKPLQDESNVMMIQFEAQARAEGAETTEPEEQHDDLTEVEVDTKEQSKLHNHVIEEPIYPQEQCVERINEIPQPCGQDPLENGEAESAEEQPQEEEQQTEVTQKGILHAMDTEMQQDLVMNQDETEVSRACVIQDATQGKNNAERNENLASSGSAIGQSRSFSCNSLGVEKACLQDHKRQDEQRRPLRQGLRSSCKKEEATPGTKVVKSLQNESNVTMIQSEAQARVQGAENTEPEEQHDDLTEEQVDKKELSKLHNDVIEEPIYPQEQCVERINEIPQSCGQDPVENEEAESSEEQPQEEQRQTEVTQKEIAHAMDTEVQQDLVMKQDETEVSMACVIQDETQAKNNAASNENLASSGSTIGQSRSFSCNSLGVEKAYLQDHKRQDEQRRPLRQGLRSSCKKEEATPRTKVVKSLQDESNVTMIQSEAQARVQGAENTEPEEQHDDLTEEQVDKKELSKLHNDVIEEPIYPQEQCVERINEIPQSCGQDPVENEEAESSEEQPQEEQRQTEVTQKEIVHAMDTEVQQDILMNQDETEVSRACVIQDETQEKNNAASNENFASTGSTIEQSKSFSCNSLGVEKACLQDHKHQAEQRRPLRQGLRSGLKKEEETPSTKNHLEQVTPVRRSLRPRKTVSEAAVITEKGSDSSKEQLKHSGSARPSKRKPKVSEAEQVSKSQKTRRNL